MSNNQEHFISHAQNFEDVMLWRALKHVEKGFYIDIGAAWPDEHSVTRAFYDAGWCGVNVEPNQNLCDRLREDRIRDINLCVAVSDTPGTLELKLIDGTGLSTLDSEIAHKHASGGWSVTRSFVNNVTLDMIWERHIGVERDVHFLKVDVEGFETQVLRGNDWSRHRPWIVVVEATYPMSQIQSHEQWEPILCEKNYQVAYADGLNRFYVAGEYPELLKAFKYPPNVFDGFVLMGQVRAETRAATAEMRLADAEIRTATAEMKLADAETRTAIAEMKLADAETRAANTKIELQSIYTSRSWRFSRPLRLAKKYAINFPQLSKRPARWLVLRIMPFALQSAVLRKPIVRILNLFPGLKRRLKNLALAKGLLPPEAQVHAVFPQPGDPYLQGNSDLCTLPPRARQIYAQLQNAFEHARKDQN